MGRNGAREVFEEEEERVEGAKDRCAGEVGAIKERTLPDGWDSIFVLREA